MSVRRRQLVFPREHGAWGMLFVPLLTGAAVGLQPSGSVLPLLLLLTAAFALFCLRTPLEALLGTSPLRAANADERSFAGNWALVYFAFAGLAISRLFQSGYVHGLLEIGTMAALCLIGQTLLRKLGRRLRLLSQIVGALGLTSTAAAAYYVATGAFDRTAIALWALNFTFAAGQVHYVQVRLHAQRAESIRSRLRSAPGFFAGQLLLLFAVDAAVVLGHLPWLAIFVVLPALGRGLYWYFDSSRSLDVHRLGLRELTHAIVFGLLLIAAFRLE